MPTYKSVSEPTPYDLLWQAAERKYQLPPGLLKSMAWEESRFNERADAGKNAGKGLMQFVNSTARAFGIDPFNPSQAIDAAGSYMKANIAAFKGDIPSAVQAYNMGVTGAKRYFGGDASVLGDKRYTDKVFKSLQTLTGAKMVALPTYRAAVSDGDAADAVALEQSPLFQLPEFDMRAPSQKSWMDDAGELSMTARLTSAFDDLGAAATADVASSKQRLLALLDEPVEA